MRSPGWVLIQPAQVLLRRDQGTERRRPSMHPGERPWELELGLPASRTVRERTSV